MTVRDSHPFEIRKIRASSLETRVILAAFSEQLVVYDLLNRSYSPIIQSRHSSSGRIAVSDQFNSLLSAIWAPHILRRIDLETEEILWSRKDIKEIQSLTISRDGTILYCGNDRGSLVVVDIESGETITRIPRAEAVFDSPYQPVRFIGGYHPRVTEDSGELLFKDTGDFERQLCATFGPNDLYVSHSGGPVRCLDLCSGAELWAYSPEEGSHVVELAYRRDPDALLGLEHCFQRGGPQGFITWDPISGEVLNRMKLNVYCGQAGFAMNGKLLITADGSIWDTSSLAVVDGFQLSDVANK